MMRMRRTAAALLALGFAASAPAAQTFRIKSRSLATVYVDAGRSQGLKPGDRLRVLTGETTVAEMEVVQVSEDSAACRVLSVTRPFVTGAIAVLVIPTSKASAPPAGVTTAAAAAPSTSPTPSPASTTPAATISGAPAAASKASAATASSPAVQAPPASPSAPPAVAAVTPRATASSADPLPPEAQATSAPASAVTDTSTASKPRSPAPTGLAPAPISGPGFRVKYRSAANAYLDGGRPEGLTVGNRLRLVSGKNTVAELEVEYLSEQSTSCRIVSETRPVRVGDVVVRVAGAPSPPAPSTSPGIMVAASPTPAVGSAAPASGAAVSAAEPTKLPTGVPSPVPSSAPSPLASALRPASAPWAHARGAASVGYFRSWDRTALALDLEQRTARLDLGLYDIAGQPLSFTMRFRSRQDVRARALSPRTPKDERNDRLYELALRYEAKSDRLGLEVGRIGIYRFVGIGYLDGGLARYQVGPHLELGGFAGRDADVDGSRPEPSGSKYGGFLRLNPGGRYATGGYDATVAFVRELASGEVSREYMSLESRFGRSRWSLFQRAELDLNRGWRQELTGKSQQLSNVSLSARLRLSGSASAFVSYDGRRNYRYQRNRLVPEEVFDDLFYQGLRAGLNVGRPHGLGFTLGGGMSLREPDPRHPELNLANAYSLNGGLRHPSLFGSGFSIGLDGSGFTNGYTNGGLASAHIGRRFGAGHFLDLSYGRSTYRVKLTGQERGTQWERLLARFELGRRVYLQSDFEYDSGVDLQGPRGFLELGVVF